MHSYANLNQYKSSAEHSISSRIAQLATLLAACLSVYPMPLDAASNEERLDPFNDDVPHQYKDSHECHGRSNLPAMEAVSSGRCSDLDHVTYK